MNPSYRPLRHSHHKTTKIITPHAPMKELVPPIRKAVPPQKVDEKPAAASVRSVVEPSPSFTSSFPPRWPPTNANAASFFVKRNPVQPPSARCPPRDMPKQLPKIQPTSNSDPSPPTIPRPNPAAMADETLSIPPLPPGAPSVIQCPTIAPSFPPSSPQVCGRNSFVLLRFIRDFS